MANEEIIKEFPVTIYGNLEKYNDIISKGRCRIFYKGANRNGTYITDAFADALLATIAYAPVKGIFDEASNDFLDHGTNRQQGRIYGIVPEKPNLSWEKHIDVDGIEREYACVDVYLYTGLYTEANAIVGKSQSMELYAKSIKGDWQIIEGRKYFVYTEARFLGLQVLGNEVEPCFEGAEFFSLYQSLKDIVNKLEQCSLNFQKGQGGNSMSIINFKMSDDQKFSALWTLLNPNYTEEGSWSVECDICSIYDDYAIVHNYVDNTFERVYYVKNDDTDSISISERKRCYIVDVDEEEKEVIDFLRKKSCHSLEQITEHFTAFENLQTQISENSTKVEELNNTIATLTMDRDEARSSLESMTNEFNAAKETYTAAEATHIEEIAQKDATITAITTERDELATYKKNVEDGIKKDIISQYEDSLSADVLDSYTQNLDNYSADELDMKLTYEVKKYHPEIFSKDSHPAYVPKEQAPGVSLADILTRYEK